jgi:CheY-like chemotaxis protein
MKRILIIEDDPRVATALRLRFETAGYAVVVAADAVLGLDLAVRQPADLILLDISLPGGNGLALVRQLRTLPETRKIPVILVTASRDPDLREKAMALRTAGLFEKPYDAEELLHTARFALGDTMTFPVPKIVAERTHAGTARILIVEDDRPIATALSLRLKAAGYETTLAHDALTAVSTAVQCRPDLALLDVSLPAGNGFSVAERLQSLLTPPPSLIFLTASKEPGLRQRAEAVGASGFFEKPCRADQLLGAIQEALATSSMSRAAYKTKEPDFSGSW